MRTILATVAILLVSFGSAGAHSFNVGLLLGERETISGDRDPMSDGFLLAAQERDSHPGQESDGHLGGLDVYLFTVEAARDPLQQVQALLERNPIDILVIAGPIAGMETLRSIAANTGTVVIAPGQVPFPAIPRSAPRKPAIGAFVTAFEREYGYAPTMRAAQGYNAARRIDAAVREQGGVSDKTTLHRSLANSENGFDW